MNMFKLLLLVAFIILAFLATGCSTTVPVTAKFPEVPNQLLVKCPNLEKLNEEAKLSDVAKSVIEALEQVHWLETVLMDYIKANYK